MSVQSEMEARQVAQRVLYEVIQPNVELEVVLTEVREHATCWVAGYNTRAFVETGSVVHALAGGGPIIINRATGHARIGTSAVPAEEQLDPK